MYEKGQGCAQDKVQAFKYYTLAADKGNAGAQFNLGMLSSLCTIFNQKIFLLPTTPHFPHSRSISGVMYKNGHGCAKDHTKAMLYYQRAADQGRASAQYNLGTTCYMRVLQNILLRFVLAFTPSSLHALYNLTSYFNKESIIIME